MKPFRWLMPIHGSTRAETEGDTPLEPTTPPQLPDPNRPTTPEIWLPPTYMERAGAPPPPSGVDVSGGPDGSYSDSEEHLWDELCRIDQLIRAQTLRWRAMIASKKSAQLWGMVHVSESEVDAYLESECSSPYIRPDELDELMRPYWERAADLGGRILTRLARTPITTPLYVERLRHRTAIEGALGTPGTMSLSGAPRGPR
jgi:hypothetical protein